ncbi:CHAT domain-containing protein [Salisaeta longa]|uniref:CHAT domain-containing protein n=1 Tax=Salisaeta longa TaxID=503170 RepID=UPI0003B4C58A|nr:CHAT domain-containing tetratricopeptide repeat protein [Salisaeta longa]
MIIALLVALSSLVGLPQEACTRLHQHAEQMADTSLVPFSDIGRRLTTPERRAHQRTLQAIRKAQRCYRARPTRSWNALVEQVRNELHALTALHQYDAAQQRLDAFIQSAGASLDSLTIANQYRMLGYINNVAGRYMQAASNYAQAIDVLPRTSQGQVLRAGRLYDLSTSLRQMGDNETALRMLQRARAALQDAPPSGLHRRTRTYVVSGYAHTLLDLEQRASLLGMSADTLLNRAQRALDTLKVLYEKRGDTRGLVRYHQRSVDAAMARSQWDLARRHLTQADALLPVPGHPELRVRQLYWWGTWHREMGYYDGAAQTYAAALTAADSLYPGMRPYILRGLGALYASQGRWAQAATAYRRGLSVLEAERQQWAASEWGSIRTTTEQGLTRGLYRALIAQDSTWRAFRVIAESRGRHLQNLQTSARLITQFSARKRMRYDSLTRQVTALRTKQAHQGATVARQSAITQALAERAQLLQLPNRNATLSRKALQASLPADGALLSYVLDADTSRWSRVFVVTPDTFRALPVAATRSSVDRLIRRVSPLFEQKQSAAVGLNDVHFDLRPLHALYQTLAAPALRHLPVGTTLTVVPDGPLQRIPFGILVTEPPTNRFAYAAATFLTERHPTARAVGASFVQRDTATQTRSTRPDIAAFGLSTFGQRMLPQVLRIVYADSTERSIRLAALPGVRREIDMLRTLFSSGPVQHGPGVTEQTVLNQWGRSDILHIATHTLLHPTQSIYNTFVLSASARDSSDGYLFLHELNRRAATQPLVYLSGCGTAQGPQRVGASAQGLQYAFRAMGAEATVATLWSLDDRTAQRMSQRFYEALQDGASKPEALQQARSALLQKHPDRASPFYWGATVLYGNPRPLALRAAPTRFSLWQLTGLLALLSVVGWGLWQVRAHRRRPRPSGTS